MARTKRDPLIAAMIAKLPDGGEWPVDRQLAWLHLMAMAFGTVYGGDAAQRMGTIKLGDHGQTVISGDTSEDTRRLARAIIATMPKENPKPQFKFYIDEHGNALNQRGDPINAKDVQGELVDLRGQDGDMKTIRWADGSTGLNGADLTIVAA